jgi:uncharacterized membrane protein HdeD (DUF308 family)
MIKTILKVLKYALIVIGVFYLTHGCFWLLNQKSSIANVTGLLGILTIITGVIFKAVDYIKKQLKD